MVRGPPLDRHTDTMVVQVVGLAVRDSFMGCGPTCGERGVCLNNCAADIGQRKSSCTSQGTNRSF